MIRFGFTILFVLIVNVTTVAHEVRPALLNISEVSANTFLVRWKVPAMGNQRLAIDPIFIEGCTASDDQVNGFAEGASVRSWHVTCTDLADSDIGFSNLSSTMIDVLVQITFLDGRYYTGMVRPSAPVFHVPDRDSEASVLGSYLALGVEHIIFGWDHLLFVVGMVLLVTNFKRLIWTITGFTVAHSVTLALAMLNVIRVPGPPVEALIALSIVFLAVEVVRYKQTGVETLAIRAPWLVSMLIGLVHGLGFAGALSEFGLPAHAKFLSLFGFNLGVEIGQLAFVTVLLVAAAGIRRTSKQLVPLAQTAATWSIGVCGAFWLVERVFGFFY